MKSYNKFMFLALALTALIMTPSIHANAMEMKDPMMGKDTMMEKDHMDSPRKQMKMGMDAHEIKCKSGYSLVFKATNWSPACVKSSSVDRLIEIGWAASHEDVMKMKDDMMENKMMSSIAGIDLSMASPVEGSENAQVTIIEFGDFQCPKCDQWFKNEKPDIATNFIDAGKVKLYFVDFAFLGEDSVSASEASYCADEQEKYWEYHNALYNNQGGIQSGWASNSALKQFASDIGLDRNQFDSCLDSGKYSDRVSFNKQVGVSNGVEGTPTFFIVDSDGNVEKIVGPQPSSVFSNTIESMLS